MPHPNRDPNLSTTPSRRSLRDHAREWLLWPDPDIRWTLRAVDAAVDAFASQKQGPPDWILTTSPPESAHAAGVALKKKWPRTKWAADFRDHWLDAPHRRERLAIHRRIGERLIARKWLNSCDLTLSVDAFIAKEIEALGAEKTHVLAHFAPPGLGTPALLPADKINIVHAGSIALSDPLADIADLLDPFVEASQKNPRLHLHLVGRLTSAEQSQIENCPASGAISIHGVKPYSEALSYIAAADAFAYVASCKSNVPPSKIVEYLTSDKPIIACGDGPWKSDARVDNADPAAVMTKLQKGEVRETLARPPSAKETAERLINLMKGAC